LAVIRYGNLLAKHVSSLAGATMGIFGGYMAGDGSCPDSPRDTQIRRSVITKDTITLQKNLTGGSRKIRKKSVRVAM